MLRNYKKIPLLFKFKHFSNIINSDENSMIPQPEPDKGRSLDFIQTLAKDHLFRKAVEEKKRGKGIYKLHEINQSFSLIRAGMMTLDIGCAPGS